MKKKLLLMMMTLMGFISFPFNQEHSKPLHGQSRSSIYKHVSQPIMFIERNVEFMVFPDGAMDFVVGDFDNMWNGNYYRNERSRYHSKTREQVYYNQNGNVALVNGIPLEYDRIGRIKRIGTTDIYYNPGTGLLKRIGGLQVNFNRKGEIAHARGFVNDYNRKLGYQAIDSARFKYMNANYSKRADSNNSNSVKRSVRTRR